MAWYTLVWSQLRHIVFLVYTAILTYSNGPYYSLLELLRNLSLFGKFTANLSEQKFETIV